MKQLTPAQIERKITTASLALLWERLWATLCWPLTLAMATFAMIYSGVLLWLPPFTRIGLVTGFAIMVLVLARHVLGVKIPTRHEAMRRIELASELSDRPISSARDTLPPVLSNPETSVLWAEHKRRQWAKLGNLQVPLPVSSWRDIDPRALRNAAALALAAAVVLGPGNSIKQTLASLKAEAVAATPVLAFDAWLKPPAYTGKPPLLLTSPAQKEALKLSPVVTMPEGSHLVLHMQGAAEPRLQFFAMSADGKIEGELKLSAKQRQTGDVFDWDAELKQPVIVAVNDGANEVARWGIVITPDNPPTITLQGEPQTTAQGALSLKWKAEDDYGVSNITSEMELADEQDDGTGISGNGVFLFDPPKFPVALKKRSPKQEVGTSTADLTAHPWAGLKVNLSLTAVDAAKQASTSATTTFRLPERLFTKPLARALIEQRKLLVTDTDNSVESARLIRTMLIYPGQMIERSGIQIALAATVSRLENAADAEDYKAIVEQLWQIAVMIEDGELGNSRDQLEQARRALEDAIRNGASPEQLKQAMDKLRQAMDRYLKDMSKQARQNPQGGQQPSGRSVSREDLQKMLDDIEKMAEGGAREQAQDMLAQLDRMLKNLQAGPNPDQNGKPGPGEQSLNKLSDLMGRQKKLMDETQRDQSGQGQEPNPQQGGDGNEGDDPGNRSGNQGNGSLEGQQGNLQDMLNQMLGELGRNGMQVPKALGEAGEAMGNARRNLQEGDKGQALGNQGEALKKLREGARQMAQQMRGNRNGQGNQMGSNGEGNGQETDPLGRPMPSDADQYGPDKDMLPTEQALRRAQEILRSLRERANTPDLPDMDRSYIDRLLRGLF